MKKLTHRISSFVFLVFVGLFLVNMKVYAASNISAISASGTTQEATVWGTTDDDVTAVLIEIIDENNQIVTLETHAVIDGNYRATLSCSLSAGKTYTAYVANYSGNGETKTTLFAIPAPTASPAPTATPTASPVPTATPTASPAPTATPTATPVPTATPTASPAPTTAPTATPTPDRETQVENFITRMYATALERDPDAAGVDEWTDGLMNREIDGAGIVYGFIMSDEFTKKDLSDEEFVDTLYRTIFDREADKEGRKTWTTLLAQGKSRGYVLAGFVNSYEFDDLCEVFGILSGIMNEDGTPANSAICQFVERCYSNVLGRTGDKEGVDNWTGLILIGHMSAEEVAKHFFASEEFAERHTTDEEYIDILYAVLLNRTADDTGKKAWTSLLKQGMSREEVLEGFARSEEFKQVLEEYGLQ